MKRNLFLNKDLPFLFFRRVGIILLLLSAAYSEKMSAQGNGNYYSNFTNTLFIPDTLSTYDHDTIEIVMQEDSIILFPNASLNNRAIPGVSYRPEDTLPIKTMCYTNPSINNSGILGPTLIWWYGDSITMKVKNDLMMDATTHWHGAHVASWNDGGPHRIIAPGSTWYPSFKIRDDVSTNWYHPHLHMHNMQQMQQGLAGMIITKNAADSFASLLPHDYGVNDFPIILQDKLVTYDSASHRDTLNWCCPMGTIPLVNGTWKPTLDVQENGYSRFRILNGSSERTYCIFIQQGRNTNNYVPFHVIASDGGYLDVPYQMGVPPVVNGNLDSLLMIMPGERYEIVFQASVLGDTMFLMNRRELMKGNSWTGTVAGSPSYTNPACYSGPSGPIAIPPWNGQLIFPNFADSLCPHMVTSSQGWMLPSKNFDSIPMTLLQILPKNIGGPQTYPVPLAFAPYQIPPAGQVARVRNKSLFLFNPADTSIVSAPTYFSIDGINFVMNVINDSILLNDIEIWKVSNFSSYAHPFHIHNTFFFITSIKAETQSGITNIPVPEYMRGPKDVMAMMGYEGPPLQNAMRYEFITQFKDFATSWDPDSAYIYHCHILSHEDGGMMHQFVVGLSLSIANSPNQPAYAWNLYPNPSDGSLWMEGICENISTVRMVDCWGNLVKEWVFNEVNGKEYLDLSGLSSGIYLLQWERKEGLATRRISILR